MTIIGLGVGRTGTYSLKLAIDQLGFGPCHHMEEVPHNQPHAIAAVDRGAQWTSGLESDLRRLRKRGGLALQRAFVAHSEAVKATIPAEQLLVCQVKDGWGPLCEFLGVPAPAQPFPRSNDRGEFWDLVAPALRSS